MEMVDVEFTDCTGMLKGLDKDLKNLIRKLERFTEEIWMICYLMDTK